MSKLEEMMKADGWELGYYVNWGMKYWSFRKKGLDIPWNDINETHPEEEGKHFKPWIAEQEETK